MRAVSTFAQSSAVRSQSLAWELGSSGKAPTDTPTPASNSFEYPGIRLNCARLMTERFSDELLSLMWVGEALKSRCKHTCLPDSLTHGLSGTR